MISKRNQPEPQLCLCGPSLILALLTSCLIVCLALRRYYDHDEFEAMKTAWKIFTASAFTSTSSSIISRCSITC